LALSDDGRTVLFDEVGEGTGGKVQIYLRATDGSPAVRLGEGEGFAISPDGRWVLAKSPPAGAKPGRLFLLPIGPGRPIELGGDFADYSWGSFLPDSKSVAYSATAKDGSLRTYIQAISGGTPKAIGPEGFRLMRRCKAASPDGKFLVGRHEGKWVLVSRDGAAADRVIPGVSSEEGIRQWSKDGRHVYVSRFEGRVLRVWLQDLATGDRRIWKEFPFDPSLNGMGVVMTPDGDAWVIGSQKTHSQLYVVEGLR
jgi:Tol biopolymer transport system component